MGRRKKLLSSGISNFDPPPAPRVATQKLPRSTSAILYTALEAAPLHGILRRENLREELVNQPSNSVSLNDYLKRFYFASQTTTVTDTQTDR